MKTTILASVVLATAMFYAPQSLAFDQSMSLRICEYVSINDKKRLRNYLKSNKVKIRSILTVFNVMAATYLNLPPLQMR